MATAMEIRHSGISFAPDLLAHSSALSGSVDPPFFPSFSLPFAPNPSKIDPGFASEDDEAEDDDEDEAEDMDEDFNPIKQEDVEEDGVNGDRMKPLASLVNLKSGAKSLHRKPLSPLVGSNVGNKLVAAVIKGAGVFSHDTKENACPDISYSTNPFKSKLSSGVKNSEGRKIGLAKGSKIENKQKGLHGFSDRESSAKGNMDLLLMALESCSDLENEKLERTAVSKRAPLGKCSENPDSRSHSLLDFEDGESRNGFRDLMFTTGERSAEDKPFAKWKQICRGKAKPCSGLKRRSENGCSSSDSKQSKTTFNSQDSQDFAFANACDLLRMGLSISRFGEEAGARVPTAELNRDSAENMDTDSTIELPLLDKAMSLQKEPNMPSQQDDDGAHVSLMLGMNCSDDYRSREAATRKKPRDSETDLVLGHSGVDPRVNTNALQFRRCQSMPARKKRTKECSSREDDEESNAGSEENGRSCGLFGEFRPGIISKMRDSKKVRAILGAVVGSSAASGSECSGRETESESQGNIAMSRQSSEPICVESKNERLETHHSNPATCARQIKEERTLSTDLFSKTASNVAARWLELLSLDLKGRISALKRSRRRVRGVIVSGRVDSGNSGRLLQSENSSVEVNPWMPMFMSMDAVLGIEGTKLENSLKEVQEMQAHCFEANAASKTGKTENLPPFFFPSAHFHHSRHHEGRAMPLNKGLAREASAASICSTSKFALKMTSS